MTNDEKDRHLVAAAVHGEAAEIFRQEQAVVMTKLEQQAADRSRSLSQLLDILNASVPDFAAIVSAAISRE